MALKQRSEQKKYLRIRDGKLYVGKDTESPFDEIEGVITNFSYRDEEYNGAPLRKLNICISDDDDTYQLGLNVESNSYGSLIGFLHNADLTKPVTLVPMEETVTKEGSPDVKKRTILVSQEGKFLKNYFTKDSPNGLPRWESVTVGKKKVLDKSAYLDFLEESVNKTLIPQIADNSANFEQKVPVVHASANEADAEDETEEKLPWE